MTIELSEQSRAESIASIQHYFRENLPEEIGNLAAGLLLNFFLEEIGPAIYNKAIADIQQHLQARITDLDSELYVEEFPYWKKSAGPKRGKRT